MAIIGINTDKSNPMFKISDFTTWMPQYKNFMKTIDGLKMFNNLFDIANQKIFYSIFGSDWKLAVSYCIAHYLTLIANQLGAPSGDSLETIAGGGNIKGVLSSASIGNFNKQYDIDKTVLSSDEALFWNQSSYGASLMALYKTKAVPSIFVVTTDQPYSYDYESKANITENILSTYEDYFGVDGLLPEFDSGTVTYDFIDDDGFLYINDLFLSRVTLDIYINARVEIYYKEVPIIPLNTYQNKEFKLNLDFIGNDRLDLLTIHVLKDDSIEKPFIGRLAIRRM